MTFFCYHQNTNFNEMNSSKFVITGGNKLTGTVKVGGSKNAALPILCATLLSKHEITLKNIPQISDINSLLKIFTELGVENHIEGDTLKISAKNLKQLSSPSKELSDAICTMRASILLLGPLLARFKEAILPFPGGCTLGKRTIEPHTTALISLGANLIEDEEKIHLKVENLKACSMIMSELSVTATENAIMLATLAPGTTKISLAAAEPHVQDLCNFLNSLGAKISGIGTHFLTIEGVSELGGGEYSITGDYLEAGTYAIAALVTGGDLEITGIPTNQLDAIWQKFTEIGVNFELFENSVKVHPSPNLKATGIRTAVYPSFPTDLQAPFAVLLTQAEGESHIFETLFEGRLNYLFELEKMGANVEILNPHQAKIIGKTKLKGVPIASIDIRAGAAMVLAALAAEGETEITNIKYIDRGYEKLEEKLTSIGAKIVRI